MNEWMLQAACNDDQIDPKWFHGNGKGLRPIRALRICQQCPVRMECLLVALEKPNHDDHGVWGGTTHRQRRDIRFHRLSITRAMAQADQVAFEYAPEPEDLEISDPFPHLGDVCVDCDGPSWLGGLRCKPCYLAQAQPLRRVGHHNVFGHLPNTDIQRRTA